MCRPRRGKTAAVVCDDDERYQFWDANVSIKDKFAVAEIMERTYPGTRAEADKNIREPPVIIIIFPRWSDD